MANDVVGPFLSKDVMSKFPDFFCAFFCVSIFSFFFPNTGMRSLPNIIFFPLLNVQTLEIFPVLPAFPVFLGKKKKRKIWGKKVAG